MLRRALLIARTVWLEFLRRKDFYVLLILVGLFVVGIMVVRVIGIENPDTARFLMSLGLLLSYSLAAILTAATASRQLPREIENRTLHPLLAKPVSRSEVILGKSLAVSAVACVSLTVFLLLSWLPAPKLPGQHFSAFAQMTFLQLGALCLLGIYTTALSLFMLPVLALLIALATFFAAPTIVNFSIELIRSFWGFGGKIAERLLSIVPDFSLFEHSQRYVEGVSPLSSLCVAGVLCYAVLFGAFFHFLTLLSFNRKQL
jgi:ABC-type transport system involved in multi-copper enzyme maturation permease subunit